MKSENRTVIELTHPEEPTELTQFVRAHPNAGWGHEDFNPIRVIIRHRLNHLQSGLCVYCENYLGQDEGHVEHIKSRTANIPLTFRFDNLAHSCTSNDHCGQHKIGKLLPIEPRVNCNQRFVLSAIDGRFSAALGANDAERALVRQTVEVLGLDHPSLAWNRYGFANSLINLEPDQRNEFLMQAPFRWSLQSVLT